MRSRLSIKSSSKSSIPNQVQWLKWFCLVPTLVYDGVFFLLPLLFLAWLGFWTTENFQLTPNFSIVNYAEIFSQMFSQSNYGLALLQSSWVAVTTASMTLCLCYPFVMMLVFAVPERYQRFLLLLAIAPFWSSYILRLYAWQTVLAPNGLLNIVLLKIRLVSEPLQILYTQIGTRIGLIHYLFPIYTVILYLSLRYIDRDLINASRNLGSTTWQAFSKVILPLSKVGIIYSVTFGIIISSGDVLSGTILGGGIGKSFLGSIPLFSTMIMNEYAASSNLPKASALATILTFLMMLVLLVGLGAASHEAKKQS